MKEMRGLICYYSGSGNTRLVCQYLAAHLKNCDFDLYDIKKGMKPDLDAYDVIGFACFADFGGPSFLIQRFIEGLPPQEDRPAFVFNTYGFMSGKTQGQLDKWVSAKGFVTVAGHSLHTPESYPPMVARGKGFETSPNEKEMQGFLDFISELDSILARIEAGEGAKRGKIKRGIFILPRTRAKKDMGDKFVDESLCIECSMCEKGCPYGAIKLDPKPEFDMDKCYGCWYCYNHCIMMAIYTKKFKEKGHYPRPSAHMKEIMQG